MKKIFSLVVVGLVFSSIFTMYAPYPGQAESLDPPEMEWDEIYGGTQNDYAHSVIQTPDGGYAIAGFTNSFGPSSPDFWLVKTDENGNTEWSKTYGGASGEKAYCIIQTSDGGYAIAGRTRSFGSGEADGWLVKTDGLGNVLWNKTYGGPKDDIARKIVETFDGGYAIAGETSSFGQGSRDFWLVKTDADGNMQWSEAYGGTGEDEAYSVVHTSDGGYAIVGRTLSFGAEDFWLVKTDSSGHMEWNKAYGGGGPQIAFSVVQTSDGGYAIGGENGPNLNQRDVWLVKTDASGNMQWDKKYGVGTVDIAKSMVQTTDGGYAIAGWSETPAGSNYADVYVIKTDANGNMQWDNTYGGAGRDEAHCIIQTSDGGYAVAGYTGSFGAGGHDFWLIKLASMHAHAELIDKYFPYLIFDEQEEYFPTDFFYLDQNIDNNPTDYDKETWPLTAYVHTVEGRWLDRASFSFLPPEEKDYLVIQYWFYYARDAKAWDIPILGAHNHDWESVFVFLERKDPEPEPVWGVYFHHGGRVWWDAEKQDTYYLVRYENPHCPACAVEKSDGTHPIVHVARGSHASYPKTIAEMSPLQTVLVPVPSVSLDGPPIEFVEFYYSEPCDGGQESEVNDFHIVTLEEPDPDWPTMFGEIPAPWALERTRWDDPGYLLEAVVKLSIVAGSPVNLLATSPDGLHVGYDHNTATVVNEIMGVEYSGLGTEPQAISILNPLPGNYTLDVYGTGTGDYTVTAEALAANGTSAGFLTFNGTVSEGKLDVCLLELEEDYDMVLHEEPCPPSLAPELFYVLVIIIIAIVAMVVALALRRKRPAT